MKPWKLWIFIFFTIIGFFILIFPIIYNYRLSQIPINYKYANTYYSAPNAY